MTTQAMEPTGYPKTIRRVQSAMIDGIIIPVTAIAAMVLMGYAGLGDGHIKVAVACFIVLLLEPVAVSVTGGTIGHHLVGLRVRRTESDKNLNLLLALIRFVVKTILGLLVFVAILLSRRRQGLHDMAARSVIVFKSTVGLPDESMLKELTREGEHLAYVSVWRRILVIAAYWCIASVVLDVVMALSVSNQCFEELVCSEMEEYFWLASVVALILTAIGVAILGWRGLLYGCRKQEISTE